MQYTLNKDERATNLLSLIGNFTQVKTEEQSIKEKETPICFK